MFVDLSLSHTGNVVFMKLFGTPPNKQDWGVFEARFRKLFDDIPLFTLIVDTTDASIYPPKWIKKFIDMMLELTPQTNEHVDRFIAIVHNDLIRKMIKQMMKLNQSERTVEFVKTSGDAMHQINLDA
jgi:hypothetical protein